MNQQQLSDQALHRAPHRTAFHFILCGQRVGVGISSRGVPLTFFIMMRCRHEANRRCSRRCCCLECRATACRLCHELCSATNDHACSRCLFARISMSLFNFHLWNLTHDSNHDNNQHQLTFLASVS